MLALSGTVDRLHLGDLLEWLHLSRQSGRLLLTAGSVTRAFDFVKGKVAFASSSRAAERMGSWLLRKGVVERRVLLRTLAVAQARGEAFTAVLERDAGVDHKLLVSAGRALATALAARVLREDRVAFRFDETWPVLDHLHVDFGMECGKLMMEAAFKMDTRPPIDQVAEDPPTTLDPETVAAVFWRIAEHLEGELVDPASFALAHQTMMSVGELLHRWVTQGPPLLPLGPEDIDRISARLDAGEPVRLEDSPTLIWDLLSLVNGLDAPGLARASSASDAWLMAGDDAVLLTRLLSDDDRWRREARGDSDGPLWRAALARAAAGRTLAGPLDLAPDTAATAAALPVVLLELVATALSSAALVSPAMQRTALRHVLPLVGHAAGVAAGLPEVLIAALTGRPDDHPGARVASLAALAAGDSGMNLSDPATDDVVWDADIAALLESARAAAEAAAGEPAAE
ncbi:MAG: DUF4388 domain-containing protein [Acidobacteriota bacterium]